MTEFVADAGPLPAGAAPPGIFRGAILASIVFHAVLIGGASLALGWPTDLDEVGVEAIAIDIVAWEEFSTTASTTVVQSSATETMQSAGVTVAAIEPVDVPSVEVATPVSDESVEMAESMPAAAVTPSAAVRVTEAVAPVPALTVTASDAVAVEAAVPLQPDVTVAGVAPISPLALVQPSTRQATSLEAEGVEPLPEKKPEIDRPRQPEKATRKPKREPTDLPRNDPTPQKKQAVPSGGNGGTSEADAAAAPAAASGKGKSGTAGNAAVDKYPGVVQRQLRRALRFPKGAGRARGEVHVRFVVSASGGASQISVVKSSNQSIIDQAAIETVERAAPFPPIPPESGKTTWSFTIPLRFAR